MTRSDAAPADVTAPRDEALSGACVAEYLGHSEVGERAGEPAIERGCVVDPERWWPNPGNDPIAEFDGVGVSYGGRPAVLDVSSRIEDLMRQLTPGLTIVIVTHNLQQAGRVSDFTAFVNAEPEPDGSIGRLVEFGRTKELFANPSDERTVAYLSGRFG
jgi:hypothetical protein